MSTFDMQSVDINVLRVYVKAYENYIQRAGAWDVASWLPCATNVFAGQPGIVSQLAHRQIFSKSY